MIQNTINRILVYSVIFLCVLSSTVLYAQQGFPQYYRMLNYYQTADSLYLQKKFKAAAKYYELAANVKVEKGIDIDPLQLYYASARCNALANEHKKSYKQLINIIHTPTFKGWEMILSDTSFAIHKTKYKWKQLFLQIQNLHIKQIQIDLSNKQRTTLSAASDDIVFRHHTPQMREYLDNDSFPFVSVNHSVFRIYFRGDSYAAKDITGLKHQLDLATKRILDVLQVNDYRYGFNLVFVDSANELKTLTGMYVHGGFSLDNHDIVFIVFNQTRKPPITHEIFHFMSSKVWGQTSSRLLNEGGAVFTENACAHLQDSIYSFAAYLHANHQIFPLHDLISRFDALSLNNEVAVYYQSAAVFKYLFDTYGTAKLSQLWRRGFDAFHEIYGFSIPDFEKQWLHFISSKSVLPLDNWNDLLKNGCE